MTESDMIAHSTLNDNPRQFLELKSETGEIIFICPVCSKGADKKTIFLRQYPSYVTHGFAVNCQTVIMSTAILGDTII